MIESSLSFASFLVAFFSFRKRGQNFSLSLFLSFTLFLPNFHRNRNSCLSIHPPLCKEREREREREGCERSNRNLLLPAPCHMQSHHPSHIKEHKSHSHTCVHGKRKSAFFLSTNFYLLLPTQKSSTVNSLSGTESHHRHLLPVSC